MLLITPEVYTSMGLNQQEYNLILSLLGREPSYTELGMFAVMWSEHCGYKYSRPVLSKFSRYKEALEGDGFENAGIVPLGNGLGVTMKVESHNHPSAVEPYQGAATGVGGIIRDILTMGARPIAGLNSLRFGTLSPGLESEEVCARNRYLFEHVVAGIGGYGNCVGVPTVGGEVSFHPKYSGNPLVNAMCVGLLRLDQVTTAAASGVGNSVVYLGSSTGKDGIHGATFASEELSEDSDAKRPNVQIGDPFAEKLLIEATLEALTTGAIVGIQDMGAAGLTCSTVEMASKGKVGMEVNLDLVPMREQDMTGYELLLSESQERMLAVVERGREHEVLDVFHRWGLPAVVIGTVTEGNRLIIRRHGKAEVDLDPTLLTDHCPTYYPDAIEPLDVQKAKKFTLAEIEEFPIDDAFRILLAAPEIASKRWVYQQYDQQVLTQTVLRPGAGDAAVLAPRGTDQGIAISLDGNSRVTRLNPYIGGVSAVVEAARNVACTGARPKAVTDGLNFGSPENPEVFWQFREAVQGIADAAEALGTPVVSGNVSFYNRSDLGEIPPTPLIGVVGVLEHAANALPSSPSAQSASLGLLRVPLSADPLGGLGASAYLAHTLGIENGSPVMPDLKGEARLFELLATLAAAGALLSAHDTSEGGLAIALAEVAMGCQDEQAGLTADLKALDTGSLTSLLFGEFPGQVVVTYAPESKSQILTGAQSANIEFFELGGVNASAHFTISTDGDITISGDVATFRDVYEGALPRAIRGH